VILVQTDFTCTDQVLSSNHVIYVYFVDGRCFLSIGCLHDEF